MKIVCKTEKIIGIYVLAFFLPVVLPAATIFLFPALAVVPPSSLSEKSITSGSLSLG